MTDIDHYLGSELARDLASERVSDRSAAIAVLVRLGRGQDSVDRLRKLADADPDPAVREAARAGYEEVWGRVRYRELEDVKVADGAQLDPQAFAQALEHASPMIRHAALVQALTSGDARALPPVLAKLDGEADEWVLATLIKVVGQLGSGLNVPRIQRFLAHEGNARVVSNTIEAIATLDPETGFSLMVPLLSSANSAVRASAMGAMVAVEKLAAIDTLTGMARSPRRPVRESALHCLNKLAEPEAEPLLTEMLLCEPERELAVRIGEVLGRKATRRCLTELAPVVKKQPGRPFHDVLASAVDAIAARLELSDDERAALYEGELPEAARSAAGGRPRSTRKTGVLKVVPPPPPRPAPAGGPPWMAILGGMLVVALGALAVELSGSASGSPKLAVKPGTTAVAAVASAATPARFFNQVVEWEGVVEGIDRTAGAVHVRKDGLAFSATLARLDRSVKPGDRVKVTGRIIGRSRLGPVYLEGFGMVKP